MLVPLSEKTEGFYHLPRGLTETCVRVVLHLSRSAKTAVGFFAMTQTPGFTRASLFTAKQKYRFLDMTIQKSL